MLDSLREAGGAERLALGRDTGEHINFTGRDVIL
jgi:hypothetical protein